jgi:hypothetical protein
MTMSFFDLAAQLKTKASISAEDTLQARHLVWPDGRIDEPEADVIFDLNSSRKDTSHEWIDFFVEAISTYIVHQVEPRGYIDDSNATWLMTKIDHDGRVDTRGDLELLVKILENASNASESLKSYALHQVETIVLTGEGPTRDGGAIDANAISDAEVKILRRLLFAQAGDGPAKVSRVEADLLFRLKDATLGANNSSAWQALFVQGVGNHLMAHSDYQPLARDDAARLETFMNDNKASIGSFFSRMAKVSAGEMKKELSADAPIVSEHAAKVSADRAITADEKSWLDCSIAQVSGKDPLEAALLAFIAEESANTSAV